MNHRTITKAFTWTLLPALAGAFFALGTADEALALEATAPAAAISTAAAVAAPIAPPEAEELAACQKIDLKVKNNKSVQIKVLRVEYKSVEDGKWRKESVPNEIISPNQTEVVKSNAKLEHVEGHRMQKLKVHYKMWCGGKWSTTRSTTDSDLAKRKCVYGRSYRIDTSDGGC